MIRTIIGCDFSYVSFIFRVHFSPVFITQIVHIELKLPPQYCNFAVFGNLFHIFDTAYHIFYYICKKLWCTL